MTLPPPSTLVLEGSSVPLRLTVLGRGGTAVVLGLGGSHELVLKWYRRTPSPGKRRRLADALTAGADDAVVERHRGVCWPRSVVLDANRELAGCLMRRATFGSVELAWLATPGGRRAKGLPGSLRQRVGVARDVAAIVAGLHEDEWIIGDLRRSNAMVRLRSGRAPTVELVDSDSFWRAGAVPADARAEHADGCAPPEVLRVDAPPSEQTDRWALGVLIFMLLCDATHPLALASSAHRSLDEAVACGPPPRRVFADLPTSLRRLSEMAFVDGYSEPALRPSAGAWESGLSSLLAR